MEEGKTGSFVKEKMETHCPQMSMKRTCGSRDCVKFHMTIGEEGVSVAGHGR